jgi:hypothetical protein
MEEGVCSFFIKISVPGNYEEENHGADSCNVSLGCILMARALLSLTISVQPQISPGMLHASSWTLSSDTPCSFGVSNDSPGILLCVGLP